MMKRWPPARARWGWRCCSAVPDLDTLVIVGGRRWADCGRGHCGQGACKPDIRVVGVQTTRFPAMVNAVQGTHHPQGASTIAEGIAVGTPGKITQEVVARLVDDLVLVDEGDIEQAVLMLLEIEKTLVEGAGAVGLAALQRYPERFAGHKVGLVLSGGNIDPLLLSAIIERGMVRSGRLARIRVSARDVPGGAGAHHGGAGRCGRQHRRGAPPACLHHADGTECRHRTGAANAQPRACGRGAGTPAFGRHDGSAHVGCTGRLQVFAGKARIFPSPATNNIRRPAMSDTHAHTSADLPTDPVEEVVPYMPVVLPVVGGIMMFLLAMIAVTMA
jgi:hypothetical protein